MIGLGLGLRGRLRRLADVPRDILWGVSGGYRGTRLLRRIWAGVLFGRWKRGDHTWFDHRIDELWWPRNVFWVERGVLGCLHLRPGDKILDLFCGDGYYSHVFWSAQASSIDAVDRDPSALRLARREHSGANIIYHERDVIRDGLPGAGYDLVLLFEGIEHLSAKDGRGLLQGIAEALHPGGRLVGSTTLVVESWRVEYNTEHLHSSLGYATPAEFAAACASAAIEGVA